MHNWNVFKGHSVYDHTKILRFNVLVNIVSPFYILCRYILRKFPVQEMLGRGGYFKTKNSNDSHYLNFDRKHNDTKICWRNENVKH